MKKFGHALWHIGTVAFGIATVASRFIPAPYDLAIPAAQGLVHLVIAIKHRKKP